MARIFEPEKPNDLTAMKFLKLHHVADYYKKYKLGYAVNDGKYQTYVDDRKADFEDCKTCKHKLTYFDCSQCHDYDEWQGKEEGNESNKDNN